MTAAWLEAIAAAAGLLAGAIVGVFAAGRQAQHIQELGAALRQDANGLGRKYARMLAFQARSIAAEIEQASVKQKLLALADLIDPK